MAEYNYRIVNVFAEERLAGNALAVFEDARGLGDAAMQALALQFNLSETSFLLPSERATARVRIFTPANEMPFAGHPTLGSAYVTRDLHRCGDAFSLEMSAGVIPVAATGDVFTLQANTVKTRPARLTRDTLASMLGLAPADLGDRPLWVNTGSEQLMIPLATPDAVARCQPEPRLAQRHANEAGMVKMYVWAETGDEQVVARFFFSKHQGSIEEDPGTGSACANLGGWMIAAKKPLPLTRLIYQGDRVGRPCRLRLRVDGAGTIFVAGKVIELGAERYRSEMLIYLHGFNSSPGSHKAQLLKRHMEAHGLAGKYCCPALPHLPGRAIAEIEAEIAKYPPDSVTLIGSSLGGFYATCLAERYKLRAVLINPAVYPHRGLRAFLGAQQNLHTHEQYELTQEHLQQMEKLHQPSIDSRRYLLLVETLDEVLDYREAVEKYAGSRQIVIEGGDHSLISFPEHIPLILEFAQLARP